MKLQVLALTAVSAALILSGCSGSPQGKACDDLRESTQRFNAGRFLALKDALAGAETLDEARTKGLEQQSKELLAQAECLPMGPERNHTLALYHDAEWMLLRYAGIRLEEGALKTTSI